MVFWSNKHLIFAQFWQLLHECWIHSKTICTCIPEALYLINNRFTARVVLWDFFCKHTPSAQCTSTEPAKWMAYILKQAQEMQYFFHQLWHWPWCTCTILVTLSKPQRFITHCKQLRCNTIDFKVEIENCCCLTYCRRKSQRFVWIHMHTISSYSIFVSYSVRLTPSQYNDLIRPDTWEWVLVKSGLPVLKPNWENLFSVEVHSI